MDQLEVMSPLRIIQKLSLNENVQIWLNWKIEVFNLLMMLIIYNSEKQQIEIRKIIGEWV